MEQVIKIGDIEKTFRSNGATPIKYRKLFKGADFFRDLTKLKNIDLEKLSDSDVEAVEKVAFTMCEDSNKAGASFEKWLEEFDLFALLRATPEIMGVITGNLETQNIAGESKNGDPAES